MCHSVDPFPLKTLGDRSGWNKVHTVPMDQDGIFLHKKICRFICANISSLSSARLSICPMNGGALYAHLESSFRDRGGNSRSEGISIPLYGKGASALFLFNQRPRQGLRQRLRRVNKASAARQQGRRRLVFVENILLSFLDFETCRKTIE